MKITIEDLEIEELISPYVIQKFDPYNPEWQHIVVSQEKKWTRQYAKAKMRSLLCLPERGQKFVEKEYARQWSQRTAVDILGTKKKASAVVWRNQGFLMDGNGLKRVYLLFIMRLIEALKPKSVLEVGSGTGINLFVLASRFPGITFSGVELTNEGVSAARTMKRERRLPEILETYSPLTCQDQEAFKFVCFQQATAENMPFSDSNFDLVFTCLALEQMKAIQSSALLEIGRVSKSSVVMIEPFAECNSSRMRKHRIRSHAYFDASIEQLPEIGLEPFFRNTDLPAKIAMGVGVVGCHVVQRSVFI